MNGEEIDPNQTIYNTFLCYPYIYYLRKNFSGNIMDKYLDLTGMETTTHIEIATKLVDEMTVIEKKILINNIKSTMKPPQPQQPPINHTVQFSFK